jgi:Raf kinase inhibitor-like YbhB/YbcL family protein
LIEGVPGAAASLTLIVDDPDAPGDTWNHWIIFNIPPNTSKIEEDSVPEGVGGLNSWGKTGYGGPCPHNGEHHYHFRLYALDSDLPLAVGATKVQVEQAMKGHVVAQTELIGRYKRQ